jgi:hypothetical protein
LIMRLRHERQVLICVRRDLPIRSAKRHHTCRDQNFSYRGKTWPILALAGITMIGK